MLPLVCWLVLHIKSTAMKDLCQSEWSGSTHARHPLHFRLRLWTLIVVIVGVPAVGSPAKIYLSPTRLNGMHNGQICC